MMKRMKKLAAIALAATMALSSTVSLAATPTTWSALSAETASGESIGNGQLEAYLDKDVFDVVLPTNESVENTFDFYADPQGLLNATQPTVYTGTAGSIYFNNKTVTSDAITVKNKSSIDVNIAMDVAVTTTGVAITTKSSIDDVKTPAVALVMTASSAGVATSNAIEAKNTSTADKGDGAVNIKEQLVSAASVYAVTVSNSSVGRNAVASTVSPGYFYSYDIKPNTPESSFKTIDFTLSGECNKVDGWKDIKANAIKTAVTWKITTDEVAEGEVVKTAYAYDDGNAVWISLTVFDGDGNAVNPGFTNISAVKDLQINGSPVVGASVDSDYLSIPYSASSDSTWNITFTYNDSKYSVSVS